VNALPARTPHDAEVLIAGGGPAGAAAAILLARAGRRVLLVEREAAPREKVCGEFLGADAAACLLALGISPAALGAVPIHEAHVARGARTAALSLPFTAWGLPRAILDGALLDAAAAAGATLRRGQAVRDAVREADCWCVRLADGTRLSAPRLLLATGKHELRGFPRAGARGGWIGVKLHLRLRAPLAAVTLLPFVGGYAGLQPSAGGEANLCAALAPGQGAAPREPEAFRALVGAGSALGADLMRGAQPMTPRPLAVGGVPYGLLHRDAAGADPALWRVGDQFAVIPSFLGDGIAMALAGGMAAAESILSGAPAPAFHAAWRRQLAAPMRLAGVAGFVLKHRPRLFAEFVAHAPGLARFIILRTRVAAAGATASHPAPG
jgi:menaquinone-9 beta-reductase